VSRILALRRLNTRNVAAHLLGKFAPASLAWDDFTYLGELRDLAARLVAASGGKRAPPNAGANLLFYGPPGTGKTEFAKTLGARLGFVVQFCGEAGEEAAEPERRERIAALMIANAIGAMARGTIVVVDEADDLFAGVDEDDAASRRGSKAFMNRLVERAAAPTIWIVNDLARLGPAVVRRMNLVLRFVKPGLATRQAMVNRIAERADFCLDAGSALALARAAASPALARIMQPMLADVA
jgi:transitional endoplasmic reticulum ATPase